MKRFNKHIIITGSARSGTSWISETMAQQYRYRMLFEPEHEYNTKEGKLLCDKWLTQETVSKKAERYLHRVFSNRVDSDWIAQNSNRTYKRHLWPFIPKKFIIKFVRCTLAGVFMSKHFQIPVIHVLRNPYDVIASQQKVKFPWLYDLSHFLQQPKLQLLVLEHFQLDLSTYSEGSEVQKLAVRWCLENVVPLEVLNADSSTFEVIRYEKLRGDVQEFISLCQRYDLKPITSIEQAYQQPSTKTHPTQHTLRTTDRTNAFSEEEYEQIKEVLAMFKTKLYPLQPPMIRK